MVGVGYGESEPNPAATGKYGRDADGGMYAADGELDVAKAFAVGDESG
jgi:hypothetical protein